MTLWRRIRILPLLILVSGLTFSFRAVEFVSGVRDMTGQAMAQEQVKAEPPKLPATPQNPDSAVPPPDMKNAKPLMEEKKPAADTGEKTKGAKKKTETPEEKKWRDALETDLDYSQVKMELFEDLTKKRKELDDREKELSTKEALLKAAEQELDQKYRELDVLKKEIQELLKQQSDEEKARTESLVKIYEGMKPKDAARIFDTLDMDVLVSVIAKMSERKTSPILAAMNPERARAVTILLAQQKQLPSLPAE